MTDTAPAPALGDFLPIDRVCESTGLKRTAIYGMIQEGTFPRPVKLMGGEKGRRRVAWIEAEVEKWKEWKLHQARGSAELWRPPEARNGLSGKRDEHD
jgi:prophage regulatory protein